MVEAAFDLACELPVTVVTKLRVPRVGGDHVPRPRLLRMLDQGERCRLTLVSAPAGYGKTTLLAHWVETIARPVAWLTLDESDAEPAAFWRRVVEALERGLLDFEARGRRPDADVALTALAVHGPAALVLDDVHRIEAARCHDTLNLLVATAPPGTQVVLSGRVDPPLPVGALRAKRELLEVRDGALRFTDAEGAELLRTVCGLRKPPEEAARLFERCEGWPAAVRLLARAGAGNGAAADRHVAALVRDEVLGPASPEERRFLARASVLPRLCGPLCDAVLARAGSAATLRSLERRNLVVPLDGRCEWYRLHGEVRRALRAELERAEPLLAPELHRRAAAWHRRAGELDAAVDHALAAGDVASAARLIPRVWRSLVEAGECERVLRWVERLPQATLDGNARLAIVRAWLLFLDGRRDEAEASLEAARRTRAACVEREIALVRAAFPWDDVRAAPSEAATEGPFASWGRGWSLWWAGELDRAAPHLEAVAAGPVPLVAAARAVLSRIALEHGDLARAEALARAAAAGISGTRLDGRPELGMVATALGAVLAARGSDADALPLLERGIRLRCSWGHPLEAADALVVAAPVVSALSGRRRAAALLAEARQVLAACPDPGGLPLRLEEAERKALPRPWRHGVDTALSARELAVLRLLARGLSKRQIGEELYLSFNTIHSHTKAIYRKLGACSRTEALARARELGVA
jgi:LuxR family maltose regulon positive regulatory protein